MSFTPRRRAGFTLLELVVAIAVIAVLIAILLPAVMNAREASRRSQCKNNLSQIGLALHNYESALTSFPIDTRGGLYWTQTGVKDGTNWRTSILPSLDQAPVFNKLDFSASFGAGSTVGGAFVGRDFDCGQGWSCLQGMLTANDNIRVKECTDGRSNTMTWLSNRDCLALRTEDAVRTGLRITTGLGGSEAPADAGLVLHAQFRHVADGDNLPQVDSQFENRTHGAGASLSEQHDDQLCASWWRPHSPRRSQRPVFV